MKTIHCPFCHEEINSNEYSRHEAEHLKRRPDGQQSEYVTLAPEDRVDGDLTGVPMWYRHDKCGAITGMPEEIVRSYLKNPYLYLADATFCTGCGTHVPFRTCHWTETDENLQTYMDRLRAEKPEFRPGFVKRMLMSLVKLLSGV